MKISIVPFLVKKLRQLIGPVEDTDTASQSYSEGDYVVWKGNLAKVNTDINQADPLSSTNLNEVSKGIGGELKELKDKISKFVQIGYITSGVLTASTSTTFSASFEKEFDNIPKVMVTYAANTAYAERVAQVVSISVSRTGFSVTMLNPYTSDVNITNTRRIIWLAVDN